MDLELHTFKTFKIYQPKNGYRFSIEPFILAHSLTHIINHQNNKKKIVDFGSGCGIIAILAAKRFQSSTIFAIEQNKTFKVIIKKNLTLNDINNVIIDDIESIKTNSIDIFVSNPPYFTTQGYRFSERYSSEKFSTQVKIEDIIKHAKRVLKNKGTLLLSFHPSRIVELLQILKKHNFGIQYIQPIYGDFDKKACCFIIHSKLSGKDNTQIYEPLFISRDSDWLVI